MSQSPSSAPASSSGPEPQERPWHESWEVQLVSVVETAQESVFPAQHITTARAAWWHVLAGTGNVSTDWSAHFQQGAEAHEGSDFAELLAWGKVGEQWVYVTAAENAVPLTKWKLRRQTSSASSIRLGLMRQAMQMALRLLQSSKPERPVSPNLMAVESSEDPSRPYRLKAHGWLPVVSSALKSRPAQVLSETEQVLNFLAAGIPWPIELTQAFAEQAANPQQLLEQGEAILRAQQERSARPTMTETAAVPARKRRFGWKVGALLGVALLMVGIYAGFIRPATPPPSQMPAVAGAPAGEPAASPPAITTSVPPIAFPAMEAEEVAIKRRLLNEALAEKAPSGERILPAALALLKLKPDDEFARELAQRYIHREVDIQINLAKYQSLTSVVRWKDFEELGFPEARLLSAVESWRTSPTSALEELRHLADQDYPAANVMIGQLLSNPDSGAPNYVAAAEYFRKASDKNHPAGQCLLGICYLENKGVAQDLAKGVALLRAASQAGDARACYRLGICYQEGIEGKKDFAEARRLFNAAIGSGSVDAKAPLALLYIRGLGVDKQVLQGVNMLKAAAASGDAESNFHLGLIAEKGLRAFTDEVSAEDGKPDPALAREYLSAASAQGHVKARQRLEQH
jgi:TPR repeat protein